MISAAAIALDGFAQTHLIADQTTTHTRGEKRAFALILVKLTLQQLAKTRVTDASRKKLLDALLAALAVAHLRDEAQNVVERHTLRLVQA
jgi:hypothetical protein